MGFLRRGLSVPAVIVRKGGQALELKWLNLDGSMITDGIEEKNYAVSTPPIEVILGRKTTLGYLCDEEKGSTLSMKRGEDVLELHTTATIVSRVMDSGLFAEAWQLKPALRWVLIALLFGAGVGFFFGLIL